MKSLKSQPTPEEIAKVADILSQLEPGFLPLPIFLEFARLSVTPIVEIVPLRMTPDGKVEILFKRRADDDPTWPNMLHTPGTVVRATDADEQDAFNRLLQGELAGVQTTPPVFVENRLHKVKRGKEKATVYMVEILGEPTTGEFHEFGNLPKEVIDTQIPFITNAVKRFLQSKNLPV